MVADRHVLVTGCSTGIGRACVEHLAARGWTVHAGVRRETDARILESASPGAVRGVILDVTDQSSVREAAAEIDRRVGAAGLAGLVNNAGISVVGPVEALTTDDWRRQFEVNFFGQVEMTRATIPLLRRAAGGPGGRARIVMISSIAAVVGQPILGPYCASKFALEALADALRIELRSQRIGVSVIRPGAISSEIWRKGKDQVLAAPLSGPVLQRYATMIDAVAHIAQRASDHAIPAARVAAVVERCLTSGRPPLRVLVGRDARLAAVLKRVLPARIFDLLMARAVRA